MCKGFLDKETYKEIFLEDTIPVLVPGKSHGQRSLAGYSPWGCKEWDMTEVTWHALMPRNLYKETKSHNTSMHV